MKYQETKNPNNTIETIIQFKQTGNQTVNVNYPNIETNKTKLENNKISLNYTINKKDIANITLPTKTQKIQTNYTIILDINDTTGNKLQGEMKAVVKINGVTQLHTTVVDGILM